MALKDEILDYLNKFPGSTDTEIERALKKNHQHINQTCRKLVYKGILVRMKNPEKNYCICNYLNKHQLYTEQFLEEEVRRILKQIEQITIMLDGVKLDENDYYIENQGCPHLQPKKLPNGYAAIYLFAYKTERGFEFLKIGKANENSSARFSSQHYGFSAPSTLAKSLCLDKRFQNLGVTQNNVKSWMLQNLHRINVLIKTSKEKAMTELIESIFHYVFRPRYEGNLY